MVENRLVRRIFVASKRIEVTRGSKKIQIERAS
jgi:hypothetical protein